MSGDDLRVLKSAILNEMEGYQFYTLAAQQTTDPETKRAFSFLAEEEVIHKSWLQRVYQQMARDILPAPISDFPSPGIFKPDSARLESGSLEVSVYAIGVLMEKASIKFYHRAALESASVEIKQVCLRLAEWEAGHLEMLEKIYDRLKEEWWDKQGFSPA